MTKTFFSSWWQRKLKKTKQKTSPPPGRGYTQNKTKSPQKTKTTNHLKEYPTNL